MHTKTKLILIGLAVGGVFIGARSAMLKVTKPAQQIADPVAVEPVEVAEPVETKHESAGIPQLKRISRRRIQTRSPTGKACHDMSATFPIDYGTKFSSVMAIVVSCAVHASNRKLIITAADCRTTDPTSLRIWPFCAMSAMLPKPGWIIQ